MTDASITSASRARAVAFASALVLASFAAQPAGAATTRQCADHTSGPPANHIVAKGVSCRTAIALIVPAYKARTTFGKRVKVKNFRCYGLRPSFEPYGYIHSFFECANGSRRVTWIVPLPPDTRACGSVTTTGKSRYDSMVAIGVSCATGRRVVNGWDQTDSSIDGPRSLTDPPGWTCSFVADEFTPARFSCADAANTKSVVFAPGPGF